MSHRLATPVAMGGDDKTHFRPGMGESLAGSMADDLTRVNGVGGGGSTSDSTNSAEEERDGEKAARGCEKHAPVKLSLSLGKKASTGSLDNSSIDGESLLEELLGDIRRSRTASLASTPTFASSEYETDCVRDCGRSEAELKGMGKRNAISSSPHNPSTTLYRTCIPSAN